MQYCFAHSESYNTYIQKQISLNVVVFLCVAFNGWAAVAFSALTVKALHLATMNRPVALCPVLVIIGKQVNQSIADIIIFCYISQWLSVQAYKTRLPVTQIYICNECKAEKTPT